MPVWVNGRFFNVSVANANTKKPGIAPTAAKLNHNVSGSSLTQEKGKQYNGENNQQAKHKSEVCPYKVNRMKDF
jgi:hypothetical protein